MKEAKFISLLEFLQTGKLLYLIVKIMVTLGLLVTGKGQNKSFWYAGNDLFLDVSTDCTGMFSS